MSWSTEPLSADVTVSGDIVAHLFASTTGSDSDWIVKLIDVYPEKYDAKPAMSGYELMIADEVLPRAIPKEFREARGDHAESGDGVHASICTPTITRF